MAAAKTESVNQGDFQETDIGLIPSDWDVEELGNIGSAFIGLTYSPRDVHTDGTLVLRSSNVQNGRLRFDDNVYVKVEVPDRATVRESDILICVRNGSRDLIGKSAVIDAPSAGMAFGAFMGLYRSEHNNFLAHVFKSDIVMRQIHEHLGATINQITNKSLNGFKAPLPKNSDEREAIADALSDADALIELLEQLIAKKREIKQGAMQELLTGKRRLAGYALKWSKRRIGDLLTIKHGKSQHEIEDQNGIYPILATGGKIGQTNRFLSDKPSVLIGRKGTIDRPQYADTPFWTVDTLFYSDIHDGNSAKFIFYRFCLIDWLIHNEASGVPSLNAKTIENIEIDAPEPDEQNAIAYLISSMDLEIDALENRLIKAQQIKQGMMQELLTGRIRLV